MKAEAPPLAAATHGNRLFCHRVLRFMSVFISDAGNLYPRLAIFKPAARKHGDAAGLIGCWHQQSL